MIGYIWPFEAVPLDSNKAKPVKRDSQTSSELKLMLATSPGQTVVALGAISLTEGVLAPGATKRSRVDFTFSLLKHARYLLGRHKILPSKLFFYHDAEGLHVLRA